MNTGSILAALSLSLLAGCASMPDVRVGYYRPKAHLEVTVIQTGGCLGNNVPFVETDVKFAEFFARDEATLSKLPLAHLGSGLTKADATFEFFPDGRLKSINGSQTGQAADVLKAFLALSTALGVLNTEVNPQDDPCAQWRTLSQDKPLTIVWRGSTDFTDPANPTITFNQESIDSGIVAQLEPIFGRVTATYNVTSVTPRIQATESALRDQESVMLVEPALASIEVTVSRGKKKAEFTGTVRVPQLGKTYELPIPRGAWFGNNTFALVLDEAGSVAKLGYGTDSGAAAMLGSATEAYKPFAAESTEARAVRAKNEADLIYQQQRLAQCRMDPKTCAK